MDNRIGESGRYAEIGDIVEVVKGRKFPIGMRMVVSGIQDGYCYWESSHGRYACACNGHEIVFVDEGFVFNSVHEDNVKIIAVREEKDKDPLYANVSGYHIDRWGDFVLDKGIKAVE